MPKKKKVSFISRPPIVAVMGHVDHGKTTLLDSIRETKVALGEKGGITQHIGAYQVEVGEGKRITFIDTPGHEAFTTMRARGGQAADIVVLVVAADEGVKPQTQEAIDHARAAKIPIIVAINKVDLPSADVQKAKEQLAKSGVVVEDWGGDVVSVEVSATRKENLENLLEMILLVAEMGELKANPQAPFEGVVIESKLDPKKGPLATVVVRNGSLAVGEEVWAGGIEGKVKAMFNDAGKAVKKVFPSGPVEVLGFGEVPEAGVLVLKSAPLKKAEKARKKITLERFRKEVGKGGAKVLNLILKSDTQGTLEALRGSLLRLETEEIQINFIHTSTGEITASDVLLAKSSGAVIVGFNIKIPFKVRELARENEVEIRFYDIIYELIKDIDLALKGLLEKEREKVKGKAKVLKLFPLPSGDVVLGCQILLGRLKVRDKVRVCRQDGWVFKSYIKTMKIKKEKVSQAEVGAECGVLLSPPAEFKKGDILEVL